MAGIITGRAFAHSIVAVNQSYIPETVYFHEKHRVGWTMRKAL